MLTNVGKSNPREIDRASPMTSGLCAWIKNETVSQQPPVKFFDLPDVALWKIIDHCDHQTFCALTQTCNASQQTIGRIFSAGNAYEGPNVRTMTRWLEHGQTVASPQQVEIKNELWSRQHSKNDIFATVAPDFWDPWRRSLSQTWWAAARRKRLLADAHFIREPNMFWHEEAVGNSPLRLPRLPPPEDYKSLHFVKDARSSFIAGVMPIYAHRYRPYYVGDMGAVVGIWLVRQVAPTRRRPHVQPMVAHYISSFRAEKYPIDMMKLSVQEDKIQVLVANSQQKPSKSKDFDVAELHQLHYSDATRKLVDLDKNRDVNWSLSTIWPMLKRTASGC